MRILVAGEAARIIGMSLKPLASCNLISSKARRPAHTHRLGGVGGFADETEFPRYQRSRFSGPPDNRHARLQPGCWVGIPFSSSPPTGILQIRRIQYEKTEQLTRDETDRAPTVEGGSSQWLPHKPERIGYEFSNVPRWIKYTKKLQIGRAHV